MPNIIKYMDNQWAAITFSASTQSSLFRWTNQQPTPVLKSSSRVKGSVFQVCTPKSCRSCKWALYCLDGFTNFKAFPYKQTPIVVEPVRGSALKAWGNSGKSMIPSVWLDTGHRILWGMLRNMRFGARLWKRKCWKSGESQVFRYQTHQGNATLPGPLAPNLIRWLTGQGHASTTPWPIHIAILLKYCDNVS